MIRSSKVSINQANARKMDVLSMFIDEYRMAVEYFINEYWNMKFANAYTLNLGKLKPMKFYPSSITDPLCNLSGRSLKSAKQQALGMINAATTKRYKRAFVLKKHQVENKKVSSLKRVLDKTPLVKPSVPKVFKAEINSINCDFESSSNSFDNWFVLKSLFNKETKQELGFNSVTLPLKSHTHLKKLSVKGKRLNSFLVSKDFIAIRFEIEPKKNTGSETIAIDQGITDLLSIATSSGKNFTSTKCIHGHDMASIMRKISRKKKGSKAFKRAKDHQTNFINWSVNQLNLSNTKELRLEEIHDMRRGERTNRFMTHFAYPAIERKLQARCEENGVRFVLQSNEYRSQRCSTCGFVHKNNRKGKSFICKHCGEIHDADINAANNHLAELPPIDRFAICGLNRTTGFLWNPGFEGAYSPLNHNQNK